MRTTIEEAAADFKKRRQALKLFDVNAWVGTWAQPHIKAIETETELLAELDRCDIEQAVVTHTGAAFSHIHNGHRILKGYLKGNSKRLTGAYVLLPTSAKEQGASAREVIDRALDDGFRFFRLFPLSMTFTLDAWCVGDLLEYLNQRRLPLIIWHNETTWPQIDKLCAGYPDLPVIIEGSGRKILYDNRILYSLLKRHTNLYVELHGLINFGLIEDMERTGIAEKIIFGTAMPFFDPNAALGMMCYAAISRQKALSIAGGTLRKMLEKIR